MIGDLGLALVHAVIVAALAPLVVGLTRLWKARLVGRRGAPPWQPYADLRKLFGKEVVVSDNASWIFRATPYVLFAVMVVAATVVPLVVARPAAVFAGNLILVMYLFLLGTFVLALAGLDTGSAFGGMGSSREVAIAVLAEPTVILAVFALALRSGTIDLGGIVERMAAEPRLAANPAHLLAFAAFFIVMVAETGRLPVDNPATHLELTMIHEAMVLEYSGRYLALIEWASAMKLTLFMALLANLFFPRPRSSTPCSATSFRISRCATNPSTSRIRVATSKGRCGCRGRPRLCRGLPSVGGGWGPCRGPQESGTVHAAAFSWPNMIVHVLACDYDGTIADHGRLEAPTAAALRRVRESGRKVMLVTGRLLPDLRQVCPDVHDIFDAVVAENGAVLYTPAHREVKVLGGAPEPALVEALRHRGVPFDLGDSILATIEPFAELALAAIRETGVERSLVFNKGAVMLLPGGVSKATGLEAALAAIGLSPHNVVGVGDAENDHAFLAVCEFAVAVADAVPALRERADHVTPEPASRGVIRLVEEHVLHDCRELAARVTRHRLRLGEQDDGTPVTISPHLAQVLVVGPTATGKSTLTGLLVERLSEQGRSICVLDPEGDYRTLSELEGVVVLGGKGDHALPTGDDLAQLLRRPRAGLVLDLSAMSRTEKVAYATQALATVAAARGTTGLPHWLIVDEAHHVFPAEGSPASELVRRTRDPVCLITLSVEDLARDLREFASVIASTDLSAFNATLQARAGSRIPPPGGPPLDRGEAALATLDEESGRAVRFRVGRRRLEHRRHVRKYVEGELPPDRSFYFRGPANALNLRAANLARFFELAEGVDPATWDHHLRRGDYSGWIRDVIKDPELAAEVASVETNHDLAPARSRREALAAIRRRYAV